MECLVNCSSGLYWDVDDLIGKALSRCLRMVAGDAELQMKARPVQSGSPSGFIFEQTLDAKHSNQEATLLQLMWQYRSVHLNSDRLLNAVGGGSQVQAHFLVFVRVSPCQAPSCTRAVLTGATESPNITKGL